MYRSLDDRRLCVSDCASGVINVDERGIEYCSDSCKKGQYIMNETSDKTQKLRCRDICNDFTLHIENYSDPFCVQNCSFYGAWPADLTTTCKDTCPASLPFKNILNNGSYGVSPMIKCLTRCPELDGAQMDFEEMEDGQLVCRDKCPKGSVYEITDLGNRCLKECKDDQTQYGNMCLSNCSQSTDLPYTENGVCVKKCPWFVSDGYSKVCLSTCRTQHFEMVGEIRQCVNSCGSKLAYTTIINGANMTGCYDECSEEYMDENIFEVANRSACVSECDSGYFVQENGRNRCIDEAKCQFKISNVTKNMTQCFESCPEYAPVASGNGKPYECVRTCDKDEFVYVGTNMSLCTKSCKEQLNVTTNVFYEVNSIRICAKECGTHPYYVLRNKSMWQCWTKCESPYNYVVEHQDAPLECVESCSEDEYVHVDLGEKRCLKECPLVEGMHYYRKEGGIKICMDSCQQQSEADTVYVFASCSENECECKARCDADKYVLPNGTCVQECGAGFVAVGQRCTDRCPDEHRYKYYVSESRTECRDKCGNFFVQVEGGQFKCVFECSPKVYKVVEDGNKQCVPSCPRYYEENNGMTVCKDYCESGMSESWKCVDSCAAYYELIETLDKLSQFNCLSDCSASVVGNTARRTETSLECVKRCDEDRAGYLYSNGTRVCGYKCPGTQRIDR